MSRRLAAWLAGGAVLCVLNGARADETRAPAPLYRSLETPNEERARELLRQALRLERDARQLSPAEVQQVCARALVLGPGAESLASVRGASRAVRSLSRLALRRRAQLDSALVRLGLAQALTPHAAEVQRATARVLAAWEDLAEPWTCQTRRRTDEAIVALTRLREDHPDLAPAEAAFDLAVLLTRSRRFGEAARTYGEASALVPPGTDLSATVRANQAETTMLAGDLEGAVKLYERALGLAQGGRAYVLALWGLALALDRLGEHALAGKHVEKALHADGYSLHALRSDGVFYEPAHELHAYEALGHEVLAERRESDRLAELAHAATSYRAFLLGDGGRGAFADTAEAGLARVLAALRKERARLGARRSGATRGGVGP